MKVLPIPVWPVLQGSGHKQHLQSSCESSRLPLAKRNAHFVLEFPSKKKSPHNIRMDATDSIREQRSAFRKMCVCMVRKKKVFQAEPWFLPCANLHLQNCASI